MSRVIIQLHTFLLTFLMGVVFVSSIGLPSVAAAPNLQINYQGKLTDDLGATVADTNYDMEFRLYTVPTGGAAIWTETRTGGNQVAVSNGLFSIMLGEVESLVGIDFNQTLYLGVNIDSDGEMSPRKILGTVPAAFEAQQLDGLATTSFLRADQADTAAGLLTFTGGLISQSSSTIALLTTGTATTTNLVINGENFTDLTGTGLVNTGGVLSVDDSSFFLLADWQATTTDALDEGSNNLYFTSARASTTASKVLSATTTLPNLTTLTGLSTVGTITSGVWQGTPVDGAFVATSTLGLGDGTFLGLSDTPGSYIANALVFASSTGGELIQSSVLRFDGTSFIASSAFLGTTEINAAAQLTGGDPSFEVTGFQTVNSGSDEDVTSNFVDINWGDLLYTGGSNGVVSGNFLNIDRGIRTSNPGSTATVTGSVVNVSDSCAQSSGSCVSSADVLRLNQTAVSNTGSVMNLTSATTNGGLVFRANDDGTLTDTTPFVIDQDGNVGIGTTSPSRLLSVAGDAIITGALYDNTSTAGSNGQVLQTTGSGFQWVATSSLGFPISHSAVTLAGEDFLTLSDQEITANAINPDNLAATDFGDFTCNGTNCSFDDDTVTAAELASGIALSTFSDDVGYLQDITGESFLDLADTPGSFVTNRVLYMSGSGVVSDADFTFDGNELTVGGTGLTLSGTTANVALGSNFLSGDGDDEGISIDGSGVVSLPGLSAGLVQANGSGVLSSVATSTLGLGDNTFLGLSDTPNSYTADRILFTTSSAVSSSSALTFTGSELSVTGSINIADTTQGLEIGSTRMFFGNTTNDSYTIGESAGAALLSSGTDNIAIGRRALLNVTTSDQNVAVGSETLTQADIGNNNTAIGYQALRILGITNESGNSGNVAVGSQALTFFVDGTENTVLGNQAGLGLNFGSQNTIIGTDSVGNATIANHLTVVGNGTLLSNAATGTIAIGYQVANSATAVDRGIFIGYNIDAFSATEDDVLNIGNLIFGQNVDGTGTYALVWKHRYWYQYSKF